MTQQPNTVEQGEDDFLFVLEPGNYWFLVRSNVWVAYRKALKFVWEDSFRVVSAVDDVVKVDGDRKVLATFVVLEVNEPIMVSATIMGAPHTWQPGDNAHTVGAFEIPNPHWIVGASRIAEDIQEWAGAALDKIEELPEAAKKAASYAKDKLEEILNKPEEWMGRIETKAFQIAALLTLAAVGALAIYRVTKAR